MRAENAGGLAQRFFRPFGIPAITPAALAVFRALLGLGLLYILLAYKPIEARTVAVRRPHSPFADANWLYALIVNHAATTALEVGACAAAVLFVLGIFARPAYVVLVVLMLVDVLTVLTRTGGHDWGLPIVTLLILTVVPWGQAPSLFRLWGSWGRFAASSLASRVYGFAIWLPGLTLGLAFAAAAYAKVGGTGIQWITNGTVRYHFVEDGRNAPITLGLWIATHRPMAVAFSLMGVLIEATFFLVIFAKGWRARAALGLMGASLMAGFTLFQGVAWWPWRILFLAFLPWTLLKASNGGTSADGKATAMASHDLTWVHATIVTALIASQLWVSYRAIEIEPFLSNFPMYAYTWSSPEEFERHQSRMRFEADGADISDRIEAADGGGILRRLANHEQHGSDEDTTELSDFIARYRQTYGSLPSAVDVIVVQRPFDWQHGQYLPQTRERIGTVRLALQ